MESFAGSRLSLARKLRTFSKKELARNVGISATLITQYEDESNGVEPSLENLDKIARCLCFPKSFFLLPEIEKLEFGSVNFRARSKMTRKQKDYSLSAGICAQILSDWFDHRLVLPNVDVPDLSEHSPVDAAIIIRKLWKLGLLPINNMIDLLEVHGVNVFSLGRYDLEVDAYSFWNQLQNKPIVMMNISKNRERGRMDAAHELGHLVLHRHIDLDDCSSKEIEAEANDFAAELLMPEADVRAVVHNANNLSLEMCKKIRQRWMVSTSAFVFRLHKLEILSDWKYHKLFKELSANKLRTREEIILPHERSQIIDKALKCLKTQNIDLAYIGKETSLPEDQLRVLTFGTTVLKKK